nr:hypothetical protein [Tanacetum cinerariifolium]
KTEADKSEEVKDDAKKVELPPTSSSLSLSLGFGDQFLKSSSDTSLIGTVKDTIEAEISSLIDIKIQYEVPHIQSSLALHVSVSMISEPLFFTSIKEITSVAHVTTLAPPSVSIIPPVPQPIHTPPTTTNASSITIVVPESNALTDVQLRVSKLKKDVSELKILISLLRLLLLSSPKFQMLWISILDPNLEMFFQKELEKHTADLLQKYSLQQAPEFTKIQTP